MERDAIRLECLKLLHRFDRPPAQVVTDAKTYEDYVVGQSESIEKEASPPKKKSGNPQDIFS